MTLRRNIPSMSNRTTITTNGLGKPQTHIHATVFDQYPHNSVSLRGSLLKGIHSCQKIICLFNYIESIPFIE